MARIVLRPTLSVPSTPRPIGAVALALLLAGCAAQQAPAASDNDAPAPAGPEVPAAGGTRYQASGTVLDKQGRGPQLCLGAVASSLPPQCSGLPLVGWDWSRVEGEQQAADTTWGEYHLVGTFDGERFTPTEPPGPPQWQNDSSEIKSACPEPAGGWTRPDPQRANHEALDRANIAAQAQPDFAGLWIVDTTKPVGEHQDMGKVVLNVAFTGDLERHTTELRKHWGGALCVVKHARTEAELGKIQESLQKALGELGLTFLGSMGDVVSGTIKVDVVRADASHQAKLDELHGPGVVVLTSKLRPAP